MNTIKGILLLMALAIMALGATSCADKFTRTNHASYQRKVMMKTAKAHAKCPLHLDEARGNRYPTVFRKR